MQALILPMHTSEDMLDRWIMKVYSPRVSSTTPLSSDMVMKAFIRRTRLSIRLSKERLRHVLNACRVRPYVCQINSTGRSSMHKCPIQASHVSYPYPQYSQFKVSDSTHRGNMQYIPLISRVFGPYCKLRTEKTRLIRCLLNGFFLFGGPETSAGRTI